MNKVTITLLLSGLLVAANGLFAQSAPLTDSLHVNSIRATVRSNGAFFLGGTNGQFLVPAAGGSAAEISLIKSAGLWLGGKDASGVLHLSAQLANENGKTDFYPGVLSESGLPYADFNLIAHVTGAQVNAHIADPGTQIPAVYSWPGRGNPYFFNYYGFDLPTSTYHGYGDFYDVFQEGSYQPDAGDYPAIGLRGCQYRYHVDESLWFAFHDVGPHTQSGGEPMHHEIQAQFFGLNCQEGSPVDRVVYVTYKFINLDTVALDSCYFGVYIDFEIGNGDDDFIGSNAEKKFIFAYNGDDIDEGGFENTPPVMAVDLLRGPLNDLGEEVDQWHFVPVDDAELSTPATYYNLLAGRHPDGTPYPNDGLMYTGDPLDPAAWSEKSDGNTPGERKALASIGPFRLLPGAVNELVLGYAWIRKGDTGSVSDNLSILKPAMSAVQALFDNCFELFEGCPGGVATKNPEIDLNLIALPNPFTDWLTVETDGVPIESVCLYDATGRLVSTMQANDNLSVRIQTNHLPAGLYYLKVRAKDGRSGMYKLVHA